MTDPVTRSNRVLVLRYHSLGDVILSTALLPALQDRYDRVEVLTERRFAPLFAASPYVSRLWIREEVSEEGTGQLGRFDRVVDLQGTARARALVRRLGSAKHIRTRSLARRWLVLGGDRWFTPRIPHAVERYAEAADLLTEVSEASARPEVFVTQEEERNYRQSFPSLVRPPVSDDGTPQGPPVRARVALLTGASRRSKEYPEESFAAVGRALEAEGWEVIWISEPGREPVDSVGLRVQTDLATLKAVLADVDLAITSDSGPMHLATALGRPTLALFGSSVRGLGFWPLGPKSRVLEVEGLRCRPCGVHGRDHCRRGDWACLRGLVPERVAQAARDLVATHSTLDVR